MNANLNATLLAFVSNPDHAVLLLLCGILLLYAEFNRPGTVILGCLGALSLMYALYGLSRLPLRPFAVVLLVAGVGCILLGCWLPRRDVGSIAAGVGGTLALVFGLLRLVVDPPVHPAVAIAAAVIFSGITTWLVRIALLARHNKSLLGPEAMIGRLAVVRTALAPAGQVEVRGELWQAALIGGGFEPRGAAVVVREVRGLELLVSEQNAPTTSQNAAAAPPTRGGASPT
jgi:membrane-bound serine protease (ClpP class)